MDPSRFPLFLLPVVIFALVGCSGKEGKSKTTEKITTTGGVAKEAPRPEVPAAVRSSLEAAMKEAVFKDYFIVIPDKTVYVKDKGQIVWLLEAEEKMEKVYLPRDFPLSGPFTSDRLGQQIKYLDTDKVALVRQKLDPANLPGPSSPTPNIVFDPPYYRLHKGNRTRCTLHLPEKIDWSQVQSVIVEE